MRVFVTGATGFIGTAIVQELLNAGHQVMGLARSEASAQKLIDAGAEVHRGDLEDLDSLRSGVSQSEGVIHAGFIHDFSRFAEVCEVDKIAIETIGEVLAGSDRPFIVTSGTALVSPGALATEAIIPPFNPAWPRVSEQAADAVVTKGVRAVLDGLDASITIMRPAVFYTNFYQSIDLIKGKGFVGKFLTLRYSGFWNLLTGKTGLLMGNYGGEDRIVFVSPKDIAAAVAEELLLLPHKKTIRYVGSEEMTCNDAAMIIGTAVGKPWLKWVLLSDREMLNGLKMAKVPEKLAETLVEMQAAMHSGKALGNFHRNNPKMGKVKLADFAKEFAAVYHKK